MDLSKENLYWDNGITKWYYDKKMTNYSLREQDDNLPALKNVACFYVIGKDISDRVMIDDKQNILYRYSSNRPDDDCCCFINMLKINKHYDNVQNPKKRKYEK